MTNNSEIKIFASKHEKISSERFAQRMCAYLGVELGKSYDHVFSDGNIFVRIDECIRDKDVYIVQTIGKNPNDEFAALLFWIDACKRASAKCVTAIIPYFGYAKGDKKDEPRVSIRARVCADCIEAAGADRVITMDLHSAQVQGFFSRPVDHLYGQTLLCEYAKHVGIVDDNLVVVSPDAGFAKSARGFADELKLNVAIGDKTRTAHDEKAKVLEIIGDVKGKNCMIVDDFTISGGTLVDLANALKDKGAEKIYAFLSHVVMGKSGVEKIENSPIEFLVSTDTVSCGPIVENSSKFRLISGAPLFAESIRRIHDRVSISHVFTDFPSDRLLRMSFDPSMLDKLAGSTDKN